MTALDDSDLVLVLYIFCFACCLSPAELRKLCSGARIACCLPPAELRKLCSGARAETADALDDSDDLIVASEQFFAMAAPMVPGGTRRLETPGLQRRAWSTTILPKAKKKKTLPGIFDLLWGSLFLTL